MLLKGNRQSFSHLSLARGVFSAGLALMLLTASAQGKGPDRLGARDDWDAMPCRMQRIPNPEADGELGWEVAIDGDLAVAGSAVNNHVHVFRFDGAQWQHQAILPIPECEYLGRFAVDDDVIVVGDDYNDDMGDYAGAAYVFRYDGSEWVPEATLYASDGDAQDLFGSSTAIDGDVIVIGNHEYENNQPHFGAAYVFRWTGEEWIEEAKLVASDGQPNDDFGAAVATEGETIIVRATGAKALYYFQRVGEMWVEQQRINPPEGPSGARFGSIDLRGDRLIAGRPDDDDFGNHSGSALIYERVDGTWTLHQKLLASDGGENHCFGCDVGICGDTAFSGAMGYHVEGPSAWAYVFRLADGTWQEVVRLEGDGPEYWCFGDRLAMDGDRAIVSAYHESNPEGDGSVYLYAGMIGVDCNNNGTADGCDIFLGTSEDLNENGIPDECECPADFDGDGDVDTADLLFLLGAWGTPDGDVDFDGDTDTSDLLALLAAWGDCPE
jgi:hypothetical protein